MRRFFIWMLPLLAVGCLYWVYSVYSEHADVTPARLMRDFQREVKSGAPDLEFAFEQLERALQMARERGDRDLQASIITRRAELNAELRRDDKAADDYRLLLNDYTPGEPRLTLALARIEAREGQRTTALGRLDRLLERTPGHAMARMNRGSFTLDEADELIERIDEVCGAVLDDTAAARAAEITRMVTVLDNEDLRRAALLREANELFPPEGALERRIYNEYVDTASRTIDAAYEDFALGLDRSTNPQLIEGAVDILRRSYRHADAGLLAWATLPRTLDARITEVVETSALALHRIGRSTEAAELVQRYDPRASQLTTGFLPQWLEIAYDGKLWGPLLNAGARQREILGNRKGVDDERALTYFYQGLAAHGLGAWAQAVTALQFYLDGPDRPEPFEGALGTAYLALADAASNLEAGPYRRIEGDARLLGLRELDTSAALQWQRLRKYMLANNFPLQKVELTLAHMMASLPDRARDLEPAWRDVSAQIMDETRLNLTIVREQLSARGALLPREDIGTYGFFLLAEHYAKEEEWLGTFTASTRVLDEVPYHTPALLLFLRACDELGRTGDSIDLLIGRQRYLRGHDGTRERLEAYRESMSNEQVYRLMRADPKSFGRTELIDAMVQAGEHERAYAALVNIGFGELDDLQRTLLGEALVGLGRHDEALRSLARIPVSSRLYPRAFDAILRAASQSADRRLLEVAIASVAAPDVPIGDVLVPALDALLFADEVDSARKLAEFLDADPATRSGTNLMRLALLELRAGRYDAAREALERALAFQADGGPALGHVLVNVQAEDWTRLPGSIAELDAEETIGVDQVGGLALTLLRGQSASVRDSLARRPALGETDGTALLLRGAVDALSTGQAPLLQSMPDELRTETSRFVSGSADAPRDPRRTLALIAALELPDWQVWALQTARDEPGQGLWPTYIEAEALFRLRRLDEADAVVRDLTEAWPEFLPGWRLAERLAATTPVGTEALAERAQAGWSSAPTPESLAVRRQMNRVRELREAGRLAEAHDLATRALETAPDDPPLLWQAAMVDCEDGRYTDAAARLLSFVEVLAPRSRHAVLPDVIDLLAEGFERRRLTLRTWQNSIVALAELIPDNALLTLLYAQREARLGLASNPVVGMFKALEGLQDFRRRTRSISIESFGRGALEGWHRFYVATSPREGEAFLREELELDPRSSELWVFLAENLVAQGRYGEARDELDLLLSMVPHDEALALRARLAIESGAPPAETQALCDRLRALRGSPEADPEVQFLEAAGHLSGPRPEIQFGADALGELLEDPDRLDDDLLVEVRRWFGLATIRVGTRDDVERGQLALAELAEQATLSIAERRYYATLARIGPVPTKADVRAGQDPAERPPSRIDRTRPGAIEDLADAPVRPRLSQDPRAIAQAGDEAEDDPSAPREAPAMTEERKAELRARFDAMTPEERDALAARREAIPAVVRRGLQRLVLGMDDEQKAEIQLTIQAMTPEELEAWVKAQLQAEAAKNRTSGDGGGKGGGGKGGGGGRRRAQGGDDGP